MRLLSSAIRPPLISQAPHCPDLSQAEIVRAGALEPLAECLREGSLACKEECARCVENLAVDVDTAALIISAGMIPSLVAVLYEDGAASAREAAAGCLWHLAINADAQLAMSKSGAVRMLVQMLSEPNPFGREEAARCLWYMALNNPITQAEIDRAGAIKPLMHMLRFSEAEQEVAAAALGALAQLPAIAVAIADEGAIPLLTGLLRKGRQETKAALALANIAVRGRPILNLLSVPRMLQ